MTYKSYQLVLNGDKLTNIAPQRTTQGHSLFCFGMPLVSHEEICVLRNMCLIHQRHTDWMRVTQAVRGGTNC